MIKRRLVTLVAAVAMSIGLMAGPAAAQQSGLVNVNIEDVDLGVIANVQVPIGIAANVCGINAAVLAADLNQDGSAECTADADVVAENQAIQRFL